MFFLAICSEFFCSPALQPLLSNISKVNVLPLANVSAEDAGEYVCQAQNSALLASQSAWLHILPAPGMHPLPGSALTVHLAACQDLYQG